MRLIHQLWRRKNITMSGLHILWNPVAGNGLSVRVCAEVCAALDSRGIPFTISKSAYPGHAVELTKSAVNEGCERILALGGDGTVREVAMGLYQTNIPMAIIPCGTGNDISRPLHIPKDVMQALDVALNGTPRRMDAGLANDELFFNVAGFGFDVDVLDYTEIYKKKCKNGSLAYLRGLVRAIAGRKDRKTVITWPEGRMEKNVLLMSAGNGTHIGGGMMVTPLADPFDGLLDICVIHDVKWYSFFTMVAKFVKGKHLGSKYVTYFRTTELTAVCDPVSRLDIDGEVVPGTPAADTGKRGRGQHDPKGRRKPGDQEAS